MAKDESFDIVSEFDQQELVNAVDQVKREIGSRFDLKDSGSDLDLEADKQIVITTTDDFRLKNIFEILEAKVSKRGISIKILDPGTVEQALGGKVRQTITLKRGIDSALAKQIVGEIKNLKLKVQPSIQGEQVRVSGKNRDDLQQVIQHLRAEGERWGVPLQFNNFR
jgi:cyclic-di-GMP-binding protein